MKIRIGHLSTFYHTAILLQAQKNAEDRMGAGIEWLLMSTGPAIMQAFRRGELDLAYIGLPPAIIGMSQGIDVICVAGGHMEGTVLAGKRAWESYPRKQELGDVLHQFKGSKIGVPGKGSIHDVILREALEQNGLSQDVGVVNYAWADLVTEAVVKDEVAAAMGTPALAVAIERFAGGIVLYPPSRIWPDNPSYGIVVDRGFLDREGAYVETFLRLHEEATSLMRRDPSKAAQLIAGYVGIVDEDFVLDTIRISPRYCAQLTGSFIASAMQFLPVLQRRGYMQIDIAQDRIFSRDLISRVHPENDHYDEGLAC
jgi:NitT/TauT family transport system substrate-binding protein